MGIGLNTNSGGGDFLPIVKYDARAGRLFRVDRAQGASGWESSQVDITNPAPTFAVDFGSITVGYIAFTATGPDFRMVPLGSALPEQPSKEHKQGFKVKIAGKVLNGVREFSASSKCVLSAIDDLHTRYEAAPEAAQGKIPVVQLTGTLPVVTSGPQGKTTNYAPVFQITGWTERLPDMGDRTVPAPGQPAQAPVSRHVPPPTAKQSQEDLNDPIPF